MNRGTIVRNDIIYSGEKDKVSYVPTLSEGTEIGTLTINGEDNVLYAPAGGGGGSSIEVSAEYTEGTKIATITVDENDTELFIPEDIVELTKAEYDALSDEEKLDKTFFINDWTTKYEEGSIISATCDLLGTSTTREEEITLSKPLNTCLDYYDDLIVEVSTIKSGEVVTRYASGVFPTAHIKESTTADDTVWTDYSNTFGGGISLNEITGSFFLSKGKNKFAYWYANMNGSSISNWTCKVYGIKRYVRTLVKEVGPLALQEIVLYQDNDSNVIEPSKVYNLSDSILKYDEVRIIVRDVTDSEILIDQSYRVEDLMNHPQGTWAGFSFVTKWNTSNTYLNYYGSFNAEGTQISSSAYISVGSYYKAYIYKIIGIKYMKYNPNPMADYIQVPAIIVEGEANSTDSIIIDTGFIMDDVKDTWKFETRVLPVYHYDYQTIGFTSEYRDEEHQVLQLISGLSSQNTVVGRAWKVNSSDRDWTGSYNIYYSYNNNTPLLFEFSKDKCILNKGYQLTVASNSGTEDRNRPIYFIRCFANQTNKYYFEYYGGKIWDGNTLLRDFIPVKRLSDGELGFFDTVTKVFYPNIGTGKLKSL